MIKRFFISLLGTIAGFWISIFLLIIVGIGIIGVIIASSSNAHKEVTRNSVLYIDLTGQIPDKAEFGDIWNIIRDGVPDGPSLIDILQSVKAAKNDKNIEGIFINASGSDAGYATREEIVNALLDFKESGKWVYSYADNYSQGDYLVCSVADSVFVNPVGSVGIHGVASQTPFLTEFLNKIGVKMQIVRVGTYKSAVEPFMNTEMSPASKLQTQVMIDSIWDYFTCVVSANRNVPVSEVNVWADSIMSTWNASRVKLSNAVSALHYRRNVEDLLKRKCGVDKEDALSLITPEEYMASLTPVNAEKKHIAVLVASGDIVDAGKGGIVGEVMAPQIVELADNEKVGALVLRVNSGGGSGFASEQIWEALEYFKSKDKPFYVSMGDYAASGGYYISCGADKIFADRTTLTGSIGVFGMVPDLSGLVTGKLGIHFSTVQTNPNADFGSLMQPLSKQQFDALQNSVENFYDLFTSRVATGRGMSQDSVKAIAEGRVWIGGDALRLGLIDHIGGLEETIAAIADASGIDRQDVVFYPFEQKNLLIALLANSHDVVQSGQSINSFDLQTLKVLRFIESLSHMNPVRAEMPQVLIQ